MAKYATTEREEMSLKQEFHLKILTSSHNIRDTVNINFIKFTSFFLLPSKQVIPNKT